MRTPFIYLLALCVALITGCGPGYEVPNVPVTCIGKKLSDSDMKAWLKKVYAQPKITSFNDRTYYEFKGEGISLQFNKSDVLTTIFAYTEKADGFAQYAGRLPYGITLQLTRRQVESKLGPPERSGGGTINYWSDYTSKGIGFTYNSMDVNNLEAKIYTINFKKPCEL